jgi:hypothetical protein
MKADDQSEVLVGLDSKQPKVVAGTIACLNEIIQYVPFCGTRLISGRLAFRLSVT